MGHTDFNDLLEEMKQIHDRQRMNASAFGDPLTFNLASSWGQDFNLSITFVCNQISADICSSY